MSVADASLSSILERSLHWEGEVGGGHCGESILIYLNIDEAVIPMLVLQSDSIASLKLRIQTCQGFVVKKQKLIFEGRELARNNAPIKDYGVTGGNDLHLVLRLSDLLFIVVRTTCGKEFEFQIDRHRNVGYLKQRIKKEGKGFVEVDVEDQELFCNGEKLDDQRVFQDICENDEDVIHVLVQKSAAPIEKDLEVSFVAASDAAPPGQFVTKIPAGLDFCLEPVVLNPQIEFYPFLWDMINSTLEGLKKGNYPIRSSEGTGGTYLMQDGEGEEHVSVFKPIDEEPMAMNNPRGLPRSSNGEGLKRGTKVGEGAVREVAAYILDHPRSGPRMETGEAMGFAGVPPTVMVKCMHQGLKIVKMGSLQKFMNNDGNCEDIGVGVLSVEEVHKITVLDIRMANADRHAGNILFRQERGGRTVLIPIDHGYCLPEKVSTFPFPLHFVCAQISFSSSNFDLSFNFVLRHFSLF